MTTGVAYIILLQTARLLEEERVRLDVLTTEIRELENHLQAQRTRSASFKDNITAIRLEVKNMTTQKDQLEQLLKEKREQCDDQEQMLQELRLELGEKTAETEHLQRESEQLKSMSPIERVKIIINSLCSSS